MLHGVHAEALSRFRTLPFPQDLLDQRTMWLMDGDSVAHVRRHHDRPDDLVAVTSTLGEFLDAWHCDHERCGEWVQALGDDAIVASQLAVAVSDAWDTYTQLVEGTKVMSRVEALQAIIQPFDRVDTITGGHPMISIYRDIMVQQYVDGTDTYIEDLRRARSRIVEASVDVLAREQQQIYSEVDALMNNGSISWQTKKPMSRADLASVRREIEHLAPVLITQLEAIPHLVVPVVALESGLTSTLTGIWRRQLVDACLRAEAAIAALEADLADRPDTLAGVSGTVGPLPIPYSATDVAHAFAWRPRARLAVLPAAVAAVLARRSGWEFVAIRTKPDDAVLETAETLWQPGSETFSRLSDAWEAAGHL